MTLKKMIGRTYEGIPSTFIMFFQYFKLHYIMFGSLFLIIIGSVTLTGKSVVLPPLAAGMWVGYLAFVVGLVGFIFALDEIVSLLVRAYRHYNKPKGIDELYKVKER